MKTLIRFIAALILSVSAASAITIDGDPSDWNVANPNFLSGDWKVNDTWVPGAGVSFIVEDNRNPKHPLTSGSLAPYTGVHIIGTGSSFAFYDEPSVELKDNTLIDEPYGYEPADLEAMYFQQDANNVYFLIVTSLAPNAGGDSAPGDLRINVDPSKNSGDGFPYELGVKLNTYYNVAGVNLWDIAEVSKWTQATGNYIPKNAPTRIEAGVAKGKADGAYVVCPKCNLNSGKDYDVPIYIIEMAIPKSAIGGSNVVYGLQQFSLVDNCTNDSISIPEFAVIALPVAGILGLVFILGMRRKEH